MTELKKLIKELCPNGIRFFSIKNLIKQSYVCTITPSIKIKRSDYLQAGSTPIVSQEEEYISGYCDIVDDSIPFANYVCFGDHSEHIKYVNFSFVQGADGLKIMTTQESQINSRYFYHACSCYYVRHNNYERHFKYFCDTVIPVPPLPVQEEIVRILDSFTELTAELTANLTAEITARKKQYEYYRDKLLTPQHSELLRISDIATTNIGLATSVTKFKSTSGVLLLHNSDIQQNAIVLKSVEYITEEFARRNASKILQKDDIITVHTGDVGTSAVIDEKYAGAIGFTTITTRIKDKSKITPQYLCHYLNSNLCKSSIASMTISDRSNLNQSSFEKLVVPVPPLETQNKIVQILDNFDSICSDLKIGLPAEIEARTKQYEYYRDKLLSFKETPTYEQKKEISKTE